MTTKRAWFGCGELDESFPEAYAAFVKDFLCCVENVDFCTEQDGSLWAHVGDDEVYRWNGSGWVDAEPS